VKWALFLKSAHIHCPAGRFWSTHTTGNKLL